MEKCLGLVCPSGRVIVMCKAEYAVLKWGQPAIRAVPSSRTSNPQQCHGPKELFCLSIQAFGQLTLPGSLGKTNLTQPLNSSYTVCLCKNENLLTQEKRAWKLLCNTTTHQHPLFVNYISSFHPSEKVDLTNTIMFLMTCFLYICGSCI